jgi:hypothetical protein
MALILALLVSGPTACWQSPSTGPGEIKWDRQTCERCQMVISERRFATQVRETGQRRIHAFDDVGCALLWLDENDLSHSESAAEVWVRDAAGTQWIDGHRAYFESGLLTPMQYGFAPAVEGLLLRAVHERVREEERRRRSEPAGELRAGSGRSG